MSDLNSLILDLRDDLTDAIEALLSAAELAREIGEATPMGRWTACMDLAAALDSLASAVDSAVSPEIMTAIAAAEKEADEAPEPIAPGDHHDYKPH